MAALTFWPAKFSNDDDCTSFLLKNKSFIESTNTQIPDMCKLHYFIALSTCLSPEESQESRLEAFVKKRWLTKTQCVSRPNKSISKYPSFVFVSSWQKTKI